MFCLLVDKDIPVILTEQNKSLAKSAQKRQNLLIQPFFQDVQPERTSLRKTGATLKGHKTVRTVYILFIHTTAKLLQFVSAPIGANSRRYAVRHSTI